MLNVNTLVLPLEDADRSPIAETMVVIFSDYGTNRVFLINYQDKPRKPIVFPLTTVLLWIEDGLITTAEMELPKFYSLSDNQQTAKAITMRERRFRAIVPIIQNLEEFLTATYGSKLVAKAAEEVNATRHQIYQWTYLYLRRGQTKNALLPDNRNRKSNRRRLSGDRLGRKPKSPNAPYKQKTPEDERNLGRVLKKHYLIQGGDPLTKVHHEFLALHFAGQKSLTPDGQIKYEIGANLNYPSMSQFRSWTNTYLRKNGINAQRMRIGSSKYDKDLKGRSGDLVQANGPGEIYQIDATPGDVWLVSQLDRFRNLVVGKPTIYSVVDVFSEAIVGIYVSLFSSSYDAVRLALFNAFRPKVPFAREVGLDITESDWPMSVSCLKAFVDNAEMRSRRAEIVSDDWGTDVVFGRAYRGDDKGLVEKSFDHFNKKLLSDLPGFIKKDSKTRGEKDPKLDAVLTLPELYRLLITYVIHHNNFLECSSRLFNQQMTIDGIPFRRRDVWDWGVKNRPFSGKSLPEEQIYLKLLEKGSASIHREGIYFNKLWYVCHWTLVNGYQDQKVTQNRVKNIDVRFMRHSTDRIFLSTPDGLQIAHLKPDSDRFQGCSFDEVELQLKREKSERLARTPEALSSELSFRENTKQVVKNAQSEQVKLRSSQIKNQSISENRALDLEYERQHERERLHRYTNMHFGIAERPDAKSDTKDHSKRRSAHQNAVDNLLGQTDDNDS
ncbi:hypothetical protein [Marinobacter sp.]|uniref:hypothetical protein n=1 Tax=Marinobacter sp. TaxID=50741 RepID=UPI003BAC4D88